MRMPPIPLSIILLLTVCALTSLAADTAKYSKSVTLSYEFVAGSSSVKPLATVFYDPKTLKYTVESWTPPSVDILKSTTSESTSSPLLRILTPNGSSTVATLATFSSTLKQKIDLWLSPDGDGSVFSASISSVMPPPLTEEEEQYLKKVERAKAKGKPIPSPKPRYSAKGKKKLTPEPDVGKDEPVKVTLIPAGAGPAPKLNSRKPPQVDSEGREIATEGEEQEKSFFQKYWWVFLVGALITMTAGGEK